MLKPQSRSLMLILVGPLETAKPPVPKIPQPRVIERKPIQKQHRQPYDKTLSPQTLYGEGKEAQPPVTDNNPPVSPLYQRGATHPCPLLIEGKKIPCRNGQTSLAPPSALFRQKHHRKLCKKRVTC